MKIHYKEETFEIPKYSKIHFQNLKLYSRGMLYERDGIGLVIVELKFDEKRKSFYYDAISGALSNRIYENDGFVKYFEENADSPKNGLYPSADARKVLWALKMPPLKKVSIEIKS